MNNLTEIEDFFFFFFGHLLHWKTSIEASNVTKMTFSTAIPCSIFHFRRVCTLKKICLQDKYST